jgi:excisionase family DNA binding protein
VGEELLSVPEAALRLHVSEVTVRRRIASGELSAVRIGERGAVRIPETALTEFCRPYHDDDKEETE